MEFNFKETLNKLRNLVQFETDTTVKCSRMSKTSNIRALKMCTKSLYQKSVGSRIILSKDIVNIDASVVYQQYEMSLCENLLNSIFDLFNNKGEINYSHMFDWSNAIEQPDELVDHLIDMIIKCSEKIISRVNVDSTWVLIPTSLYRRFSNKINEQLSDNPNDRLGFIESIIYIGSRGNIKFFTQDITSNHNYSNSIIVGAQPANLNSGIIFNERGDEIAGKNDKFILKSYHTFYNSFIDTSDYYEICKLVNFR